MSLTGALILNWQRLTQRLSFNQTLASIAKNTTVLDRYFSIINQLLLNRSELETEKSYLILLIYYLEKSVLDSTLLIADTTCRLKSNNELEKQQRNATICKDLSSSTPLEAEQDQQHLASSCSMPRYTTKKRLRLVIHSFHHLKYQTQQSSRIIQCWHFRN